jgi:hypothetical protein
MPRFLPVTLTILMFTSAPVRADTPSAPPSAADPVAAPKPAKPAAAAPKAASSWPEKIGPFSISDKSGRFSVAVGLAAQIQVKVNSSGTGSERDTETTIFMRRIRPTLKGTALSKDLKWYLHLSTAPGAVEFMDFYLDYTFAPYLRVRAGDCKIPFTRYRVQSFKHLTLVDWSVVTRYFGAERQYGVTLHSGFEKPTPVEFALGIYTGENARASHSVGLLGVYGEPKVNPSNLLDPQPPATFHPEIVGRVAYNHGGIDVGTDTDFAGGGPRFSAGVSLAWDTRPTPYHDLSLRLAPELLFKAGHFSMTALGYLGFTPPAGSDSGVEAPRLGFAGALAQVSYIFMGRLELAARYGMVVVMEELRDEARARANSLVAAETDSDKSTALAKQYKNAGLTEAEHEVTLGVNVYIIGRSLKWQNDLSYKAVPRVGADTKHDIQFRTQLGLAF